MQVDPIPNGRATKVIAAIIWLIVAPSAGELLAFKLRFVLGTAGFVFIAIVLPTAIVGLVGLALGGDDVPLRWRSRR